MTAKCLTTSQERQDYDTQDFVGAFMAGQGSKAGGIGYEEGVSPVLKAAASGSNRVPTIHGAGVRRLTPTECERLQGFPDGWTIPTGPSLRDAPTNIGIGTGPGFSVRMAQTSSNGWGISEGETGTLDGASPPAVMGEGSLPPNPNPRPDGPRYAQMGNAVTVPVAEWIGRRIREYG